jgi:hypothetical protein
MEHREWSELRRTDQMGRGLLVLAADREASKPVVTARVDHRRCEKCGYEFIVRSSLTEARRSLLVMESGGAISSYQPR